MKKLIKYTLFIVIILLKYPFQFNSNIVLNGINYIIMIDLSSILLLCRVIVDCSHVELS